MITNQRSTEARLARSINLDPTRTLTLRRQMEAEISRRFNYLKAQLNKLLVEEDALGLGKPTTEVTPHSSWRRLDIADKVDAFEGWIGTEIQRIAEPGKVGGKGKGLIDYLQDSYIHGLQRSWRDTRDRRKSRDQATDDQIREEFIRQIVLFPPGELVGTGTKLVFNARRNHVVINAAMGTSKSRATAARTNAQRVKDLSLRLFTDLKGVTRAMAQRITREIIAGLDKGDNPRTVAREIVKIVDNNKNRAQVIARTEMIRAHAEAQLDGLERLGIAKVSAAAEWRTAGDTRVCPLCESLQSVVLTITEARNLIPRHPSCRCAWVPANVGESEENQKRSYKDVAKAFRTSIKKERGSKIAAREEEKGKWPGEDKTLSKKRPTQNEVKLVVSKEVLYFSEILNRLNNET